MNQPMAEGEPKPDRNPVRRLNDWMLAWADHRSGATALGVISFAESSFFPIPPDPLLLALCLGRPHKALAFGCCTDRLTPHGLDDPLTLRGQVYYSFIMGSMPKGSLPDTPKLRRLIVRSEERTEASAMARELSVQRFVQPDDTTCGPTCLRKVYGFYGLNVELDEVVDAIERNEDGGTLAVFLGMAALRRGLRARIYSYDLQIFDPTWSNLPRAELVRKIRARSPYLTDAKRRGAAVAYVRYLEKGGELLFDELTPALLKSIIDRGHPVLAGLSATYLYGFARERWDEINGRLVDDDIAGDPTGHFIVVSGYDQWGSRLTVLDPSEHVPATDDGRLIVSAERLINSILLGDVTYDAVLLELWPAEEEEESA